jgi:hypothetical protein
LKIVLARLDERNAAVPPESIFLDSLTLPIVALSYSQNMHKAIILCSRMLCMKIIDEIRYENLMGLVLKYAGPGGDMGKGLTRLVEEAASNGKTLSRPTLYQILTKRETSAGSVRQVGSELARDIEEALRLNRGYMDNDHAPAETDDLGVSLDRLQKVIALFWQSTIRGQDAILESAELAEKIGLRNQRASNDES